MPDKEITETPADSTDWLLERAALFRERFAMLEDAIGRTIVGHGSIVRDVLITLFADGHCLLEGVPGLGKTLLVRTLARALDLEFGRIQFTPDLMPADVTGTQMIVQTEDGRRRFNFVPGPIFANILLADEINRATPKTQSALLEAMQERRVTISSHRRELERPFLVLATQNPIEMQGTYPLPEAQLDRFMMKLKLGTMGLAELEAILDRTTGPNEAEAKPVLSRKDVLEGQELARLIYAAPVVEEFASRLTLSLQPCGAEAMPEARAYVRCGPSPRGAQALILAAKVAALLDGRFNISFEDVESAAFPSLRHRVSLNNEGRAAGADPDDLIAAALNVLSGRRRRMLDL
ncbi:MAG TPA: AAA family ATPase [Candidatus Brocadiia bacterium]|nr:AAA family ATPase [Candidatus Brocadiia bacterium]